MRILNRTRGRVVAERAVAARRPWERARGLLGRSQLAEGEGLFIDPCNWIHSFGMRFPIDVVYLDREGRVVHLTVAQKVNRLGPYVRQARAALELPVGSIAGSGTQIGDILEVED